MVPSSPEMGGSSPRWQAIEGVLAYPSVEALPTVPDLAVIATPPATIPELITALAVRGTRAAVIVTPGFEGDPETPGEDPRTAMLTAAREHNLRIVGPNSIGVMDTWVMAQPCGFGLSQSTLPVL